MSADVPAPAASGTLNPFFARLTLGLTIPFAIFNGLHAFVVHSLPNPVSRGTVIVGQFSSYLGTLVCLALGLAAFHRTQSPFLKVGGGFLFISSLALLLWLCMSL